MFTFMARAKITANRINGIRYREAWIPAGLTRFRVRRWLPRIAAVSKPPNSVGCDLQLAPLFFLRVGFGRSAAVGGFEPIAAS